MDSSGRAAGPDSPATIAQLIPLRFNLCNGPSNCSSDKNFVFTRTLSEINNLFLAKGCIRDLSIAQAAFHCMVKYGRIFSKTF